MLTASLADLAEVLMVISTVPVFALGGLTAVLLMKILQG